MDVALEEVKREGIRVISASVGRIAVTLLHPKDTHGVFVDLHTDEERKPKFIDPNKYVEYKLVSVTEDTRKKPDPFVYKPK